MAQKIVTTYQGGASAGRGAGGAGGATWTGWPKCETRIACTVGTSTSCTVAALPSAGKTRLSFWGFGQMAAVCPEPVLVN